MEIKKEIKKIKRIKTDSHKFFRTSFIPDLHGKLGLLKEDVGERMLECERTIIMGNFLGVLPKVLLSDNNTLITSELFKNNLFSLSNWDLLMGENEIVVLTKALQNNGVTRGFSLEATSLLWEAWAGNNRRIKVAYESHNRLVTHGGLTYNLWKEIGSPQTAKEASEILNKEFAGSMSGEVCYKTKQTPNFLVSPTFCDPISELYPSWLSVPTQQIPFSQIHASTSLKIEDSRNRFFQKHSIGGLATLSRESFGSVLKMNSGGYFIGLSYDINTESTQNKLMKGESVYVEKIDREKFF